MVNVNDVLGVIKQFGPCACLADLDGDGLVGVEDLLSVLKNWSADG